MFFLLKDQQHFSCLRVILISSLVLFIAFQSKLISRRPSDDTSQSFIQMVRWICCVSNKFLVTIFPRKILLDQSLVYENLWDFNVIVVDVYDCFPFHAARREKLLNNSDSSLKSSWFTTRIAAESERVSSSRKIQVCARLSQHQQSTWHLNYFTMSTTRVLFLFPSSFSSFWFT